MKNLILSSLFFFTTFSLNLYGQSYNVAWTDLVGVTANGNSLVKTAAAGWGNAGASSENVLGAGQDGWVEMTISETDTYKMFGLASPNNDPNFQSINYAIQTRHDATIFIYENGIQKNITATSFSENDRLRVERIGQQIYYKKDGMTFYTSTVTSTGELIADVSLNNFNSTITNAQASFPVPNQGVQFYDVVWTDLEGVTANGNSLTKTAGASWENGGAASENILPAGQDGWVEMTANETNSYRMMGLSSTNASSSYTTINYALQLRLSAEIKIYENGQLEWVSGTYQTGGYSPTVVKNKKDKKSKNLVKVT